MREDAFQSAVFLLFWVPSISITLSILWLFVATFVLISGLWKTLAATTIMIIALITFCVYFPMISELGRQLPFGPTFTAFYLILFSLIAWPAIAAIIHRKKVS